MNRSQIFTPTAQPNSVNLLFNRMTQLTQFISVVLKIEMAKQEQKQKQTNKKYNKKPKLFFLIFVGLAQAGSCLKKPYCPIVMPFSFQKGFSKMCTWKTGHMIINVSLLHPSLHNSSSQYHSPSNCPLI